VKYEKMKDGYIVHDDSGDRVLCNVTTSLWCEARDHPTDPVREVQKMLVKKDWRLNFATPMTVSAIKDLLSGLDSQE
jgi:hypothetical protein